MGGISSSNRSKRVINIIIILYPLALESFSILFIYINSSLYSIILSPTIVTSTTIPLLLLIRSSLTKVITRTIASIYIIISYIFTFRNYIKRTSIIVIKSRDLYDI